MGREVRRVPQGWEHPKEKLTGHYKPLHSGDGLAKRKREWDESDALWMARRHPDQLEYEDTPEHFESWDGNRPSADDHMPEWTESERTHFQMYEDTTEGTPISPVMEAPEALARWLADNSASSFAGRGASYEQWLRVCRGGFAPSMVSDGGGLRSGVEALGDEGKTD